MGCWIYVNKELVRQSVQTFFCYLYFIFGSLTLELGKNVETIITHVSSLMTNALENCLYSLRQMAL